MSNKSVKFQVSIVPGNGDDGGSAIEGKGA